MIPNRKGWMTGIILVIVAIQSFVLFASQNISASIELSTTEKSWITAHPNVRIGIHPLPIFVDQQNPEGDFRGLSIDWVRLLEDRLGMRFNILNYPSWSQLLDAAKNREVDVLLTLTQTPERNKYLDFSPPYYKLRYGIITHQDKNKHDFKTTLSHLTNQQVAFCADLSLHEKLKQLHPSVQWISVADETVALKRTADKSFGAVIMDALRARTLIRREKLTDLSISEEIGFSDNYCFSSRNDWPELAALIKKGMASISKEEHERILNRWVIPGEMPSGSLLKYWMGGIAILAVILFALIKARQRISQYFAGSIRRNLLLLVLIALLPAIAIIHYMATEQRREVLHNTQLNAFRLADETANSLQRTVSHIKQVLMIIAQMPGIQVADETELQKSGNEILQPRQMLDIVIFNRKGDILAAGKPILINSSVSSLSFFNQAIHQQSFTVGDCVISAHYNYPMLHFAYPIRLNGRAETTNHFVAKVVQLDSLDLEFDARKYPEGTTLFIVDRSGVIVYQYSQPSRKKSLGQPIDPEFRDLVFTSPDGNIPWNGPNEDSASIHAVKALRLDKTDPPYMYSIVSIPNASIYAKANRNFIRNIKFLAVAIILALFIAMVIGNKMIVNILDRMARTARALGSGDLSARINLPLTQAGELGRLARVFDEMADNLQRDRMERERLEAQLRQQQKLESIGTLASGVAHEINNPVNGIMNYAQLLLDKAEPESRNAKFASEIIHESKRVAAIVRNLLQFARHEKQTHAPAGINDILESTLSLTRAVMRHDQIIMNVKLPESLPKVKCHSQQIQQVLMNLLTNARDALNEKHPGSHEDKIIFITCDLIQKEQQPWIRISVEDHGSGIPAEVCQRIFDPFFTTKPRDKGTGLGLSISHGIMKDHGGMLRYETELGKWTRFHMELPVDNPKSAPET